MIPALGSDNSTDEIRKTFPPRWRRVRSLGPSETEAQTKLRLTLVSGTTSSELLSYGPPLPASGTLAAAREEDA